MNSHAPDDLLAARGLLATLTSQDRTAILASASRRALSPGEYLVRRGEAGDAAYIVTEGLLEVVLDESHGDERVVGVLGPGEVVGEMALLSGESRSASVRAVTDAQVLALTKPAFESFLLGHPEASVEISRALSRRLAAADAQIASAVAGLSALVCEGAERGQPPEIALATLADVAAQLRGPAVLVLLGARAEQGVGTGARLADACRPAPGLEDCWIVEGGIAGSAGSQSLLNGIAELRRRFRHVMMHVPPAGVADQRPALRSADRVVLAVATGASNIDASYRALSSLGVRDVRLALVGNGPWRGVEGPAAGVQPVRVPSAARGAGTAALARVLTRRTVGLALSSGAAQGLAHVGVMQGLVDAGVPVDAIAGTSGGALYGSMYAAGLPLHEIRQHLIRSTRRNLNDRVDLTIPRRGLIRGDKVERLITDVIGARSFDTLAIPLCAVAADLDTGAEVPLDRGPVHRAVRASISIPGVFVPARVDGRTLIDGAVVNPLPVSVVRRMGADVVVAVQVPAPGNAAEARARVDHPARERRHNLVSTLMRSYYFASDALASAAAAEADFLVKPDVALFGWRDYRSAAAIIDAGVSAGAAAAESVLARWSQPQ